VLVRSGFARTGGSANPIDIYYEDMGNPNDPAVLLIMGLGAQLLLWRKEFCEKLVDQGLRVIRYDNRDVGLSTKVTGRHTGASLAPRMVRSFLGLRSPAVYTLEDVADDAAALLDHLQIDTAHIVGASMGGMVAQLVALRHPARVRSLTSIMSTTGAPGVGAPAEAAMAVLFAPPATDREGAVQRAVDTYRVIGSPGFEFDETGLRERAGLSFDRAYDPAGVARQLAAVLTTADRTPDLAGITAPTLVIHGAEDALVHVSGGRATAAAIPDAELLVVDGMGHDLPRAVWPQLIERMTALFGRAG
jgi:pimeloyl-ACP methyl ester carboxylesterase